MTSKVGMSSMRIGARLRDERGRLALTHTQMGAAAGVSRNSAAAWEKGTPIPSAALALLAEAGFDVQYVLTGIYSDNANAASRNASRDSRPVSTIEEWEILRLFRELDAGRKKQAKELFQILIGNVDAPKKKASTKVKADRGSVAAGGDVNIGKGAGRRAK